MTKPFEISEKSRKILHRLEADAFGGTLFTQLEPLLLRELRQVPDPEQALVQFERFSREVVSKTSLYRLLLDYPHFLEILLRLFATSRYLSDILIRHTEYFYWLTTTGINQSHFNKKDFWRDLFPDRPHSSPQFPTLSRLKRLKRREILRIGTLDILGWNDLSTTVQNLSDLADTLVQAGLTLVQRELEPKFGLPPAPFAVVGLGKLGGRELNYSSDIDIVFIYAEEGTATRRDTGKSFTFHEYFNRLSEKLVHLLSEFSEGEALYRVDTRLRPEGEAGPLARSVASALHYYEIRGRLWERQMLIKARPVAGNLDFAEDFLRQLRTFIYPATFFRSPLEEIHRIKQAIEEKLRRHNQGDRNIKLSQGGIRDVEFAVQALQLLNGGRLSDLREPNTLRAVDALASHGLLTASEARTLRKGYIFFRKIEHHLQLEDWRQTHLLPEAARRRFILARKLGFPDWHSFRQELRQHMAAVRRIYDHILMGESAHPRDSASAAVSFIKKSGALQHVGFRNLARARKILERLAFGTRETPVTPGEREAFLALVPILLPEIGKTPDPDETLQNLENLFRAHGSLKNLFLLLKENQAFRRLLVSLAGNSSLLIRFLTAEPGFFSLLLPPGEQQLPFSTEQFETALKQRQESFANEKRSDRLLYLKHFFQFRAGIHFLENLFPLPTIFRQLSELADAVVLQELRDLASDFAGEVPFPAEVFALGKWGVRDLNFGSDLDVLFLTKDAATLSEQETVLRRLIARLSQITPSGQLYKIDARLRAEGSSAPLLLPFQSYQNYLLTRGQLWERQALLRFRPVLASSPIWHEFRPFLESYLFDSGLSDAQKAEITGTLRKIHAKTFSKRKRELDFKNAPGGIVHIEFLTQIFQLKYGRDEPILRHQSTADLLKALHHLALLSEKDAEFLRASYLFYRRLEAIFYLGLQRRRAVLPLETGKILFVARASGFAGAEDFLAELEQRLSGVKQIWAKLFG